MEGTSEGSGFNSRENIVRILYLAETHGGPGFNSLGNIVRIMYKEGIIPHLALKCRKKWTI